MRDTRLGRRKFLQLGFVGDVLPSQAAEPPEPHRIPDVALRTRAGESVRFYQDLVRDHIVVIHLLCAAWEGQVRVLENLERVHDLLKDRFGNRVWLLSVSTDVDSEFLERTSVRAGPEDDCERWLTLCGDAAAIDAIRRAIGAWDPDPRVDADRSRFAGLLILGSDRADRWTSLPALLDPIDIVARVCRLDES